MKWLSIAIGLALALSPLPTSAQGSCPPEVQAAKDALKARQLALAKVPPPRQLAGAKGQEVQAPRGQDVQAPRGQDVQAPRGQDVQAPRGQDVQAPRGQDVQAPRGQDVQAPRGQDVQAPRGQDVQAPRGQEVQAPRAQAMSEGKTTALNNVARLVKEAELACKENDNARAAANARAALELARYLE